MGEGTTRIANTNGARVRELGHETEATRRELDELVTELDRRRHQAFDWRLQVRRHARALAMLGAGVVVVVGIGVAASIARKRRRPTLATRLSEFADWGDRLRLALGRIVEDPDRLAKKEPARPAGASAVRPIALGTARVLLPHLGAALGAMRRSGARAGSPVTQQPS
jgi:hypothetical protein